jgi:capsular exopolysaccharide synthesis family protein
MTEKEFVLNEEEESIDIKSILNKLVAHWYLFIIFPIISIALGFIYTQVSSPVYKLSSSLIVKDEKSQAGLGAMFEGMDFMQSKSNLDNKIEIIKSYNINEKAYNSLDLSVSYFAKIGLRNSEIYNSAPFRVKYNPNSTKVYGKPFDVSIENGNMIISFDHEITDKKSGLKDFPLTFSKQITFGENYKTPYIDLTIFPTKYKFEDGVKYSFVINRKNDHIQSLRKNLIVELASKKSSVINTSIKDEVAKRGVDYLNALNQSMIGYGLNEKNQISVNTIKFIDNQLKGIVDSLGTTESRLLKFRSKNKVIDISAEGTLLFNRTEKLIGQKAEFTRILRYFEYLEDNLKHKDPTTEIISPATMGVGDQVLAELTKQHNVISNEMASMRVAAHEINPSMIMLKTKLNNIRETIVENLKGQVDVAKQGLAEVDEQIKFVEVQLDKLPKNESALLNIQRKYTLNNELYTFLLQKRAETGISLASNVSDVEIIDEAKVDQAVVVSFKTKIVLLIALIIGLIIPIVIIYIKSLLNTKVDSIDYLEKNLKLPIVASLGRNNYKKDLVVKDHPNSSIAESFRVLRSNLKYLSSEEGSKVIITTSTVPGEGKSFTSTNLSAILAMAKYKVLLVGLDLRKPVLHNYFSVTQSKGLSTYLIRKDQFPEIVTKTTIENLDIVASGPIPPNPSELIESERMTQFIEQAKAEYDYVILDTPPVGLVGDVLQLSKHSDIILHMIRYKHSKQDAVKFINDLSEKHHIKNMNIVFNGVKTVGIYGNSTYGYGMEYYAEEQNKSLLRRLFRKR